MGSVDFFPEGETVHYFGSENFWVALCGRCWFHCTNDWGRVTCQECIARRVML